MTRLLTDADWRRLVKDEIIPAFPGQLSENFATHADFVGRKLMAERWRYEPACWCVGEIVAHYRRLDNLLAMMTQARDGRVGRDGEPIGGWYQSPQYRALCAETELGRDRVACVSRHEDGADEQCGTLNLCRDCDLRSSDDAALRRREAASRGRLATTELTDVIPGGD